MCGLGRAPKLKKKRSVRRTARFISGLTFSTAAGSACLESEIDRVGVILSIFKVRVIFVFNHTKILMLPVQIGLLIISQQIMALG
jgi:hypothetical protein